MRACVKEKHNRDRARSDYVGPSFILSAETARHRVESLYFVGEPCVLKQFEVSGHFNERLLNEVSLNLNPEHRNIWNLRFAFVDESCDYLHFDRNIFVILGSGPHGSDLCPFCVLVVSSACSLVLRGPQFGDPFSVSLHPPTASQ